MWWIVKGEILNQYEYDVWGNSTVCKEKVPNRFKFNGQQYYLRARYYNPVIGRFTQKDTYRGDGLNLYAYCANNLVYYVDPSGYSACSGETDKIKNLVNKNKVNHSQGFSNKGYNSQPKERTFDGKGIVHGRTGKTVGVDTLLPDRNDVKQLYQYLNNGKYHK